MIEISHAQARRLVSAQIDDLKLPDEQWAALYAHLENCTECTEYRDSLRRRERDLRRKLRDRWLTVDGPDPATGEIVLAARGANLAWRAAFRKAGVGMLGLVLLLMAWMGWQSQSRSQQQAAVTVVVTATPIPTPTATPIPTYRGQIVYQSPGAGGAMDIYLLNSGVEPVNLTDNPAEDFLPAWSPDGEWLAFISDRSGKREVWVMHVSGARLTQITDDPGVLWWGPISWSPDGQMLALIGQQEWLGPNKDEFSPVLLETHAYLIPLDGSSGPVALGSTRGAEMVTFAPGEEKKLAFAGQREWNGAPVVYYFNEKRFLPIDTSSFDSDQRRVSALAWSLTGTRLLYQADGPYEDNDPVKNAASMLRVVDFRVGNRGNVTSSSQFLSQNIPVGIVSAPGWTGIKDEYSFLIQSSEGCANLILNSVGRQLRVFGELINEMCVEGAPPIANWRTTNKSVVVKARRPGDSVPGLYVLGFPGSEFTEERLIDLDPIAGSVQLRPQAARVLVIDPTPARTPPQPPSAVPPGEGYAEILFTTKSGNRTFIEAMRPDGTERRLINQSVGYNGCPVWSPDRKQIAFLSDRDTDPTSARTVAAYLMNASGLNTRLVGAQGTSCPRWSPDGGSVLFSTRTNAYIVGADSESTEGPAHLWVDPDTSPPMWLPNGELLVFEKQPGGETITARSGHAQNSWGWSRSTFERWKELFTIHAPILERLVDISENGANLLYAGIEPGNDEASLYSIQLESGRKTVRNLSSGADLFPEPYTLRRLPDGSVALVFKGYADSEFKTAVYIFDIQSGEQRWLARLPDALIEAHWSADGRYVLLNTESGLWSLDIPAAQRGEGGPMWIADIGGDPFSWEE